MTAQAAPASFRTGAIKTILVRDFRLLGPLAIVGAIAIFIVSVFFHSAADVPAWTVNLGSSQLNLGTIVFVAFAVITPVALGVFVLLLAQTDAATDTRRDWLVRPVAPLEVVAAKAAMILAVIVVPTTVGDLIYMALKPAADDAFTVFLPMLSCCIFLLVVSWLVSTPFQAVLAVFGLVTILIAAAISIAFAIRVAIGAAIAGDGGPAGAAPFPVMADSWILSLASFVGLLAVSGVTLWLLLARRNRAAARWLFAGYFAVSMAARFILFETSLDEKPQAAAAQHHAASTLEAAMTRHP